ncbi:MAG: bifunctional metallophosphatase/5'-nucleotidase [Firmicutes bacterium]|nr:bifunctional metallophosphatase/5'-nucleotidase [Bacillota bacterium]
MKKSNKILAVILVLMMLLIPAGAFAAQEEQTKEVSIIFSHDMHSHMDSEKVVTDGEQSQRGGIGRTSAIVKQIMTEYPDSILVDGGDFAMGTAYQTMFSTEATELRMMGKMGYTAATFGNHEFDYGSKGLADMLNAAVDSGDALPQLLCANLDWETSLAESETPEDTKALKEAFERYGVKDYVMIEKDGVNIALFGIMGVEAASFAPLSGVYFADPVEESKRVVREIRKNEDADVIVCLSHSGTWEDPEESEDQILAKEVPEIDVIVSGHTHTELPDAIVEGDTAIVSCGAYNYKLGHVVLEEQKDGSFKLKDYKLVAADDTVTEDSDIMSELAGFRSRVSEGYFGQFGYSIDQVLATNDIDFTPFEEFGAYKGEDTLGNIIADSYIYAVAQAEGPDSDPVDVAVVPSGVIRGSFFTGDITTADAFNISSLGQGPDGISGYPLVSAYLTGKELKDVAEVDASVSDIMSVARLYMGGLQYDYNMHRMFLNRATDIQLVKADGSTEDLVDDQLYRITADMYSCQMLSIVKDKSFGLLKVEPKDADGNPITDFNEHIVYNDGQELKAWYALASYIDSFEGDKVPEKYAQTEGRKNDVTGWNPAELVKQPNKVGYILMAAVAVLILAVIGIVKLVKHIRRKRRAKK